MNKGKYIVIEGPEGVGKSTQIVELERRLRLAGLAVKSFKELDRQTDLTARTIRNLTQDPHFPMNNRTEVLLYNAARSQTIEMIKNLTEHGVNCIVDQNYLTTLAIQYYGLGDVPDYNLINSIINFATGGTEPDLCIVLDAPVSSLLERINLKSDGKKSAHVSPEFLERVRAGYLWEAKQRSYPVVFATESYDQVAEMVWRHVSGQLAVRSRSEPAPIAPPLSVKEIIDKKVDKSDGFSSSEKKTDSVVKYLDKDESGRNVISDQGYEYLDSVITNSSGNVYAFKPNMNPVTTAAAMARLSRRADDMRITILDEFAGKVDKDSDLLKRVITAYGDDSVQQLTGIHFVVENASNLLSKKIEWGRLAAYLEQSTRYIYFDQKDSEGKYKYYVPESLKPKTKKEYIKIMDQIFDNYSKIVRDLTDYIRKNSTTPKSERDVAWNSATRAQACDAARAVLPTATKTTIGIYASAQSLESMIMHLASDELPEAKKVGQEILAEGRKILPMFLERADKPDRGGAIIAYRANTYQSVKKLTKKYISNSVAKLPNSSVSLVEYTLKNELDLVPDMIYEHSNLSLEEIKEEVSSWSFKQKQEVFNAYIGERLNRRQKPGRALEKSRYSFDIICDYGSFRDLQRHRMVDDMSWQALTPRYGYEIPRLIEDAGLADLFENCFDISLKLHSYLTQEGYDLEAQYATLLGHRMRWKITYNAREAFHFHELRTSPQGHPGYRRIVNEMHNKLAEVHPTLAEAMKFVNRGEDPELSRLAAEKYTQFKLEQLKKH